MKVVKNYYTELIEKEKIIDDLFKYPIRLDELEIEIVLLKSYEELLVVWVYLYDRFRRPRSMIDRKLDSCIFSDFIAPCYLYDRETKGHLSEELLCDNEWMLQMPAVLRFRLDTLCNIVQENIENYKEFRLYIPQLIFDKL